MFRRHYRASAALALAVGAVLTASVGRADITYTGSVNPIDPTTWTNSGYNYIGYSGDGAIYVADGSHLLSGMVYIGYPTNSTGTVTIDGVGTSWVTNYSTSIGLNGTGHIIIQNGGTLLSKQGVSIGSNSGSMGTVLITGTNSTWTNAQYLTVGNMGIADVNIVNGGTVNNTDAYIGSNQGSVGTVTVDGTGSVWNNSRSLTIGRFGAGILNIYQGSIVNVANETLVGLNSGQNTTGTGAINFGANGGTLNTAGLYVSPSQLTGTGTINTSGIVTDANLVFDATHGQTQTFALGGITINLNQSSANVLGAGFSSAGSLTVIDGQNITSSAGVLGYNPGSSGTATVDGIGSTWTNGGDLNVGYYGNGTLNITNGGAVFANQTFLAAQKFTSPVNSNTGTLNFGNHGGALTTGTLYASPSQLVGTGTINTSGIISDFDLLFDPTHGNSQVLTFDGVLVNLTQNNTGSLGAGYVGSGSLTIANGTVVNSNLGYLGYNYGAMGTASINGSGSTWTTLSALNVGNFGNGILNITNGGNVNTTTLMIGFNYGSSGTISIDGAGSKVNCSNGIEVGYWGTGALNITHGGTVIGGCEINSGVVVVDGPGSSWTNNRYAYIGNLGNGSLNIINGGLVSNTSAWVGSGYTGYQGLPPSTGIVNCVGSTWNNSGILYIGTFGTGIVNITSGGLVSNTDAYVGSHQFPFGSNTTALVGSGSVTVDGLGSKWTSSGNLYIGYIGTGSVTVTNGAIVSSSSVTVGSTIAGPSFSGVDGSLTIDGAGSTLTDTGNLKISGIGKSTFKVTNGGIASSSSATLGLSSVIIDGSGSSWSNNGSMTIDGGGSMVISNGGSVQNSSGTMGNCTITVDGSGSTWSNSGSLTISNTGTGVLNVTNGGRVSNAYASVGSNYSSNGIVNVDGIGSTWTSSNGLTIGDTSKGTVNITNGGYVHSLKDVSIGRSSGTIYTIGNALIDGIGSTLLADGSLYIGQDRKGSLSITHGGLVMSNNASFSSNGTVTVDGTGSTWTTKLNLSAGGTLMITNGGTVNCNTVQMGSGTVKIDGINSTWNATGAFNLGVNSLGVVRISNGGIVNTKDAVITYSSRVSIDGSASQWNSNALTVGSSQGSGNFSLSNGASLSATSMSLANSSRVTIDVGSGSTIRIGNGTGQLSNGGTILVAAGPQIVAGTYTPIRAGTWSGSGSVQALGGKWNTSTHTITVATAVTGTSGIINTIDLATSQRLLITDPVSGAMVGAGFVGTSSSKILTFMATIETESTLSLLQSVAGTGQMVLSGWDFSATSGYTSGNPVYLSEAIGAGFSADQLSLWHFNGSAWTQYTTTDLSYDGTYANFTVTGFSGYAVTAAVPEPGSLGLLGVLSLGLLRRGRRGR